jgi:hypothetical protein
LSFETIITSKTLPCSTIHRDSVTIGLTLPPPTTTSAAPSLSFLSQQFHREILVFLLWYTSMSFFELVYLSLIYWNKNLWDFFLRAYGNNLWHVYKLFSAYFHKLSRITYQTAYTKFLVVNDSISTSISNKIF